MDLTRRGLIGGAAMAATATPRLVRAQTPGLKIGVLTDMSGTYRDASGPLSIVAVQQALEEFGVGGGGIQVDVISADHQNKPDIAANLSRQWFDRDGVDMIVDGTNSACGLAIAGVAKEKNKIHINSGAATSDITGVQCNANTLHWTYDTYMLAKSTGGAMVKAGGDSWFFITADYAFGHTLERDCTGFVTGAGGKVLGAVAYPFPTTTDFSSQLLQAQSSGAKVIGLATAGVDTANLVKQAHEFGITQGTTKLAGLLTFISDVHAIGLEVGQGLIITNSFYWDGNDRSRALSKRLEAKFPSLRPGMIHAGDYSGVLHYMKTVKAMGVAEAKKSGAATVAEMKKMPTEDDAFGAGSIRADGRVIHPSFLWELKKPSESKYAWDYLKPVASTPAAEAFRPLADGKCSLVG
ncbi:ABC transporter substrate-binding protein [Acidisphaera sp. L21]|uniref:ABC transporter substrate-binding protein n=1 Tax=Acidisphaera sp. L21 TaxID=1641851 RepID=UPI00131D91A9|nr:ABC transporter substrate-binding protein [Acidisphaera sp. L21]